MTARIYFGFSPLRRTRAQSHQRKLVRECARRGHRWAEYSCVCNSCGQTEQREFNRVPQMEAVA